LFENSVFMIAGAILAVVWANLDPTGYHDVTGPFHWLVNDVAMAFFFAIAAAEVWEAVLPGGALSSPRRAATPLVATAGGMIVPAGLYLAGVFAMGETALVRGAAIPMATDIAFSYLIARFIFGPRHAAIPFLLLLAIADDAAGLLVLALFYPQAPLQPLMLVALVGAAMAVAWWMHYVAKITSFWWYLVLPGVLSWLGFYWGGLHPALGLIPVIPFMPHAESDLGIFNREELGRDDTLDAFENWWSHPVELILGAFGLVNAGVAIASVGTVTALVLAGLLVGKPVGIVFFVGTARRLFGLQLPEGMDFRDLTVVGLLAGIGFTVALFMATAAWGPDPLQAHTLEAAKMGALLSFAGAPLAFAAARIFQVRQAS
jgi:NhaA family Na+:H+ antiporter